MLEKLDEFQADVQKRFYRKMVREPKYVGTEPEMKKISKVKAHKAIAPLKEKARKLAYVDVLGMYQDLYTNSELHQELMHDWGSVSRCLGYDQPVHGRRAC